MKKYSLIFVTVIMGSLLWAPIFSFAQTSSGISEESGIVEQPSDEIEATRSQEELDQELAEEFGQETARYFYSGQISAEEARRRYQEMHSQGLNRDYMRGYNTWKSRYISEEEAKEKEKNETSQ